MYVINSAIETEYTHLNNWENKMETKKTDHQISNTTEFTKSTRRKFIKQSVGCAAASLTLLNFPGIISDVLAAKEDKTKEKIQKELEEKAMKFMMLYGTCSQASFCSLNEVFNLKGNETIRALKPFAGGIAGKGETCGAVTGSLLALALSFEPANPDKSEKSLSSMKYGSEFFDRFQNEFGSTRCSKVVEHQYGRPYDFQNPEDMKLFMEVAKSGKCLEVVKKAVLIAADIISEKS
jgi:C_GCAxxG_C_C family probable redox protein